MDNVEKDIISILKRNPGLSDKELAGAIKGYGALSNKELAEAIKGYGALSKCVNQKCRTLESQGILWRYKRDDGLIGSWLIENTYTQKIIRQNEMENRASDISEKIIKNILSNYLNSHGWTPKIFWGVSHGIDIEAMAGKNHWIIQVKGAGLFHPIIINNFLLALGEILQRMDDPNVKYSVALPDKEQFRRLWDRLPDLAKSKLGITALFVNPEGKVEEKL